MIAETYDPVTSLRHWPTPMGRFGQNPYGQNLYRVVFASSRRYLVSGQWADGSVCARWVPKYKAIGDQWIMEKWLPAEEYAGVSKELWDRNLSELGPWPERGEYELCHVFETGTPDDANIEKLITWIELGKKSTLYQKIVFAREQEQKEREANAKLAQDIIRNKLPAFGASPIFSSHVARGTKTYEFTHSAQELGLPMQKGRVQTKTGPKIPVPVEINQPQPAA